jgi:hypothetical protein
MYSIISHGQPTRGNTPVRGLDGGLTTSRGKIPACYEESSRIGHKKRVENFAREVGRSWY